MMTPEEQSEQLRSDASRYLTVTATAPLFQPTSCRHGASALSSGRVPLAYVTAYQKTFYEATRVGNRSISECLTAAHDATLDKYKEVCNDPAKMKTAMSCFMCSGTDFVLSSEYACARGDATIARYLEQYIAVELKQKHALG